MLLDLLKSLGSEILDLIDQSIEDKDLKQKLKAEIQKSLLDRSLELTRIQGEIIKSEAQSESFLTRNWRPLTMLTFTSLMVADWLGFTAPNLTPELKMKLFDIIHLGLGGYVVGRSFEKVLPKVAEAFSQRKPKRKTYRIVGSADEEEELL